MSGKLLGFIDEVSARKIRGWATYDGKTNGASLDVKIVINDNQSYLVKADRLREGLIKKGIHSTGCCEFELKLPVVLQNNTEVRASVAGKNLNGSPWYYFTNNPLRKKRAAEKIYYVHIPKTAGSTLNYHLGEYYGSHNSWVHFEGNKNWSKPYKAAIVKNYNFLSAHMNYVDVSERLDLSNYKIVTLLRNPLKQLISHLNWVARVSDDPSSRFFKNHPKVIQDLSVKLRNIKWEDVDTLHHFVKNLSLHERNLFDNCQTRYLVSKQTRSEKINVKCVDEALKNLEAIDVVGQTERYDDFLNKVINVNELDERISKESKNISQKIVNIDTADSDVIEILSPLFEVDTLVYQQFFGKV